MAVSTYKECPLIEKVKERDKIGVWGFGNVSRDVFLTLVSERLGKEIVFYGRPKEDRPNRARTWVEDLKANSILRPRIYGTNKIEDMTGLDLQDFRDQIETSARIIKDDIKAAARILAEKYNIT